MKFIKRFLHDLATLRKPVTATAVVAEAVALTEPFGIDLGSAGSVVTGVLIAVGAVAAYIEHVTNG